MWMLAHWGESEDATWSRHHALSQSLVLYQDSYYYSQVPPGRLKRLSWGWSDSGWR